MIRFGELQRLFPFYRGTMQTVREQSVEENITHSLVLTITGVKFSAPLPPSVFICLQLFPCSPAFSAAVCDSSYSLMLNTVSIWE